MDTIALVIVIMVTIILSIFAAYYLAQVKFERKFKQWQEAKEQQWQEEMGMAKQAAIAQSRAVLGGKFTEQMAPYLPEFRYDPTEARFIGNPIDFIVFPGLASGDPQEIIIMEIKSGKNYQLTPAQRRIQQLIEDGMVRWEMIQKPIEGES